MIKSKLITDLFQKSLNNKDIRELKNNLIYYLAFRVLRSFLENDIILRIYNFKVFGSINRNKTSYFLLKKCDFGDNHELDIINKFSKKNKILFFDCGCNYGFYSFYVASLSDENRIIAIEASKNTLGEFIKNLNLNNFKNIKFFNKAVSDSNNNNIIFNESKKDWESSLSHNEFTSYTKSNIQSAKIDTLAESYNLNDYLTIIKLDIEGNEMRAIEGSLDVIKKASPLIIIEFSKYIFNKKDNIKYFKNFLLRYEYSIYDTNCKKQKIEDVLIKLSKLKKRFQTIGNFYLIKNSSKILKEFLFYE